MRIPYVLLIYELNDEPVSVADSGGCPAIVKLELLQSHTDTCEFNPFKPVVCEKGCGIVLLRNQVEDHNCLSDLRELVSKQQSQINDLEQGQNRQSNEIVILRGHLKRLQDTEVNEHSSTIKKLQSHINRLQVAFDTVQKQQKEQSSIQLHPSSNLLDDEDCDCDTCEPSLHLPTRNCLYSSVPKKRIHSWKGKDFPSSKRLAVASCSSASTSGPTPGPSTAGGKPCHAFGSNSNIPDSSHAGPSTSNSSMTTNSIMSMMERSAPSPYSESEILRHNYYHSHGNHNHGNNCPMSPQDLSTTSNMASSSSSHHQLVTFYGQVITVAVTEDDIVEDVKAKIERKESIPIEQQLLFFAGQQLEDDKPLTDYGIIGSETLKHLVLRLRDGMKIMVKTLSDKTIEVQVDPSETIEIVKVKIHEQEGISPCDQRLLQDGRDLADLRTLSDYGIKHGTTLQLDLHLGGPCPICQTQFRNTGSGSTCGDPSSPLPSSSSFINPNSPSTSSTRSNSGASPLHSSFFQSLNTPTSSSGGKGSSGKGKGSSALSSPSSSTAPPAHLNSIVSTATSSSSFSSPSHHGQSRGKQ